MPKKSRQLKNPQKPTSEQPDKVLIIDDREPVNFIGLVTDICPIPIQLEHLKTGDYVCDDVYIERKTINDFAGSILDRRVFKQADRLAKFPHPYIVISGRHSDVYSKVTPHALIGAKVYLATHGVTVLDVDNEEEMVYTIIKLLERHGKLYLHPPTKSKPKSI